MSHRSLAPPAISVIIPFRNARGQLPTIVEALKRQTLDQSRFEVIWIDDASRDEGGDWLRTCLRPGWRILVQPESRGSYAARNAGLRTALSDRVAFTDVDCRPDEQWLEQGLAALSASPRVAGRIHLELSRDPSIAELVDASRFLRQRQYVQEGFAATANLFVRRHVFDLVGAFDEHLQSGGDHEFGWRCSQAGLPIVYAEQVVVAHPARASLRQLLRKGERVGYGIGQIVRRRGMSIGALARSGFDRLTLVRKRALDERPVRTVGLTRSFLVTAVHLLLLFATILGCLKGLVAHESSQLFPGH
jgi:hypothetical protein